MSCMLDTVAMMQVDSTDFALENIKLSGFSWIKIWNPWNHI